MAHEISKIATGIFAGKNSFAYVGGVAWHGLGNQLALGASMDEWAEASGLNFTVKRSRVRYVTEENQTAQEMAIMEEKIVLFRSDNLRPLGIVSADYKVVQPREVLEFFQDICADMGFTLETAGVLFDGKRFFALAKVGNSFTLAGVDKIGGYLLLSTSCDGTLATAGQFTTVRVVCNNTLRMALGAKNHGAIKVYHSSEFDAAKMKTQLGIGADQWDAFTKNAAELAIKKISLAGAEVFLSDLFTEFSTKKKDIANMAGYQKCISLFTGSGMGSAMASANGTAWGLLNSVTEWVDHHKRATSPDHRIASALWAEGDDIKTWAANRLIETV